MNKPFSLKIHSKNYMDCLDVLIYSISIWVERDYRMQYVEAWGFQYSNDTNKRIYERIGCGRGKEYKYLEMYHGIQVLPFKVKEVEFGDLLAKEEMPLLFQYDCYWAKWKKDTYKKSHLLGHHVLLTGYNKDTKEVFILDNQEASEGIWYSINEFLKGVVNSYQIRVIKNYSNRIDEKVALKTILGHVCPKEDGKEENLGLAEKMELFIEDMKNMFDIEVEVRPYLSNLTECTLLTSINDVAKGRKKAALAIECIAETSKNKSLSILANKLRELSEQWKQVFGVFVKYCYMNADDRIRKNVVRKIEEIKTREAEAIKLLKECYYQEVVDFLMVDKQHTSNFDENVNKEYLYSYININQYYNNIGCYGKISDNTRAELSNPYRYLCVGKGQVLEFDTQNILDEKYDNIICQGQVLSVNKPINNLSKIMFLMCSEFTSCEIVVELIFSDGSIEIIKVGVTSWLYPEPEYSDEIALVGKPVQRKGGDIEKTFCYNFLGNIYASRYELKSYGKELNTIKLPDCENVHVFAISIASVC